MNDVAMQPATDSPHGVRRLQDSFAVFNRVTRDLESAYRALDGRARRIEERLSRANAALTERVRDLSRVTRQLNGVLEAIPSGVVVADAERTVVRVNAAAELLLGRPAEELVGRAAGSLRGGDHEPLLLLGRPDPAAAPPLRRAICLDGSRRHLQGTVVALADGGFVEVLSDRTEVAHLRSQVHRLDTLAALGEMAAGVAHEIRNPMNGIEGFAGLLARTLEGDEPAEERVLRRYASCIRRGVTEVNAIINDLLAWARPERLSAAPFALSPLLREVVRDVRTPDHDGAVRVRVDAPGETARVHGDRLKLKLVLANLVRNACEAAKEQVVLSVRDSGPIAVHVDDDGPGIAPAMRARLFVPFATDKASGTGLGLAIARKLVELHDGRLDAGDGPLGGARFTVTLPVWEATP